MQALQRKEGTEEPEPQHPIATWAKLDLGSDPRALFALLLGCLSPRRRPSASGANPCAADSRRSGGAMSRRQDQDFVTAP
jgi:hypothetical protein